MSAAAAATIRAFCARLDRERSPSLLSGRPLDLIQVKRAPDGGSAVVRGYASVFGVRDAQDDVVEPGAFGVTIAEHRRQGLKLPMLWQHRQDEPIGIWDELTEDKIGLRVEGRLLTGVRRADEALTLIAAGAVGGLSIGYRSKRDWRDQKTGARHLVEIELFEISLVSLPSNREARVGKSGDVEIREAMVRVLLAAKARGLA